MSAIQGSRSTARTRLKPALIKPMSAMPPPEKREIALVIVFNFLQNI
jgi:hypothetical protein